MRKYIFTESQMKKIISNQIQEQTFADDQKTAINFGSMDFLKSKGISGNDLTEKIMKYQKMIGCEETGHMMDCVELMYKHSQNPKSPYRQDLSIWKKSIQSNKPIYDRVGDWLTGLFGVKKDPKSIY